MQFDDTDSQWRFLNDYRGKMFNGTWPTIVEMLDITTLRFPGNRAFFTFVPKEESFTYIQVHQIVGKVAGYLANHGIKKGDKIAVTGKNSPEWAMAFFAILSSGAIAIPLDNNYHEEEIKHFMDFVGAKAIFADADKLEKLKGDYLKISLEEESQEPFILACQEEAKVAIEKPCETDIAAILFTSGTTGTPKGAMLTHANMVSDGFIAQSQLHILPGDVFYAILPIHHAYTLQSVLLETVNMGVSCLFGKKLMVSQLLKDLKDGQVTMFLGVPMIFNKLIGGLMGGIRKKGIIVYGFVRMMMGISGFLKSHFGIKGFGKGLFKKLLSQLSLDSNRLCICGGGPLPASTYRMFNELGIDFVQGYGLTEASPMTHLTPPAHFIVTSVGRSFPLEETKILDPDEDGNGEILIKGPNIMQGYYNNPEATAEVLDKDGFLHTGDVGHIDKDNYLYITGRAKSIIVTEGGKNVFPEEIEDHFQLFDDIAMLCIIGYTKNEKFKTEGVKIVIYPSPAYVAATKKKNGDGYVAVMQKHMEEIVAGINKELRPYQKIEKVTLTDKPLPLSSTGKVRRFLVKKEFAE